MYVNVKTNLNASFRFKNVNTQYIMDL